MFHLKIKSIFPLLVNMSFWFILVFIIIYIIIIIFLKKKTVSTSISNTKVFKMNSLTSLMIFVKKKINKFYYSILLFKLKY